MGKGRRIRNGNNSKPPNVPGIRQSPYANAFTKEELAEAMRQKDVLVSYFRDAMKLDGTILGIDEATLQLLMLHGALAGVTVDESRALIRPRRLPDATGRLMDSVQWIPKRHDTEEARREDAEEEARRRKAAMDVQLAQMSPEVRDAFERQFAPVARKAFIAGAQHEQRYRDDAEEETPEARALRAQAERLRSEGKLQ